MCTKLHVSVWSLLLFGPGDSRFWKLGAREWAGPGSRSQGIREPGLRQLCDPRFDRGVTVRETVDRASQRLEPA